MFADSGAQKTRIPVGPSPAQILRAADEVEKPGGWCQFVHGDWKLPDGAVCAAGAVMRVLHADGVALEEAPYWRFEGSGLPDLYSPLTIFNDAPGRTASQVTAMLRWTARLTDNEAATCS